MEECPDVYELDVQGLTCPLPVLRLKQALKNVEVGTWVHMVASDPSSQHDIESYCRQTGHELIRTQFEPDQKLFQFWIAKSN